MNIFVYKETYVSHICTFVSHIFIFLLYMVMFLCWFSVFRITSGTRLYVSICAINVSPLPYAVNNAREGILGMFFCVLVLCSRWYPCVMPFTVILHYDHHVAEKTGGTGFEFRGVRYLLHAL